MVSSNKEKGVIMIFAKNIKYLRLEKNWSQEDLSDKLGYRALSTVAKWESGVAEPPLKTIKKLALLFGVPVTELVNVDLSQPTSDSNVSPLPCVDTIKIKVYGTVPAGPPVEAAENVLEELEIPGNWVKGKQDYFGFKVQGDSMSPKYLSGDIVIVRQQPVCESGQDCIVYVNGYNSTLKRVVKYDSGVMLQPLNPAYEAKFYDNVAIVGIVVKLVRDV